ncbi:MAG: glycine--tRNA ligase [Oligoflexia bacterium]|nr:glycine--tRNA ligase [Oligoflexia bacterium]
MATLVSLCKRRGFIFPSSEVYGGINSCWDYGPLGIEIKLAAKQAWWSSMTHQHDDVDGIDASILMHPRVWEASGHVENFNDPLVDCKKCKARHRADHLKPVKELEAKLGHLPTLEEMASVLSAANCPSCGSANTLTAPRLFNMMFKTHMGPVADDANTVYLRPETAQGIFVNFRNVQETMRRKLPFGIAQIGKAFRNEITPGNFTFRTREFEQMEMQYFVAPGTDSEHFERWKEERIQWHVDNGLRKEKLRFHPHGENELAHYAKQAGDIEYEFPIGWSELEGIHNRTDFDLKRHTEFSGKSLQYTDEKNNKYIPYVIETSVGCDRFVLSLLCDAYRFNDERVVMQFMPKYAPYKLAVFPLMKKDELMAPSEKIFNDLRKEFRTDFDVSGSIGKRYRRHEEIGTPFCLTVDYDSLIDKCVTIRHRDTMKQERISWEKISEYVNHAFSHWKPI